MYSATFFQRFVTQMVAFAVFTLWLAQPALAQGTEWERLNQKVIALYKQGSYRQAAIVGEEALSVAEKTRGPDHPDVATSLSNLATMYQSQGQYERVETLLKRSLAILEKTAGSNHPDVAQVLDNLAALYRSLGKNDDAEPLSIRALAIREKALGAFHPAVAESLNGLASGYYSQAKYALAEPLYQRALAIHEKAFGPVHPDVATSVGNLALLYSDMGRYVLAEQFSQRALAIDEKALGSDHPDVAIDLNNLAALYVTQGHYLLAEPIYKRALAIQEKALGKNHPDLGKSLNNLALSYIKQGQYAQAEPLYKRALSIREVGLGLNHPQVADSLNNLASFYKALGRYAQAESLLKRALTIYEKSLGPEHPDVAMCLNNLAELYRIEHQLTLAEPLYRRSLVIYEKVRGPEHADVATILNNLGGLFYTQGQYEQALPLYRRALTIREKSFGTEHPSVANSLANLALALSMQHQYAQAVPLYKRAILIREKTLGSDHPDLATTLNNLAGLYRDQGQYIQAEPLFRRALAIREKVLGADHPELALSLNNLAAVYAEQGKYFEALSLRRRASSIYRNRIIAGGTDDAAVHEASNNQAGFFAHLDLLSRNLGREPADRIADEGFQIVQLAQASGTASAIAKMAARFAGGNDALAGLVKRKQDAADRLGKEETQLVTAASKPPQQRIAADEQKLREDIVRGGQEITAIDGELTQKFPQYQELTRPEPVTISQVRALLKPTEAMLIYALGNSSSFLWVVKPDGAYFFPINAEVKDVAAKVAKVRSEMETDSNGRAQRVSVSVLHELYQRLFAPAVPKLLGVQHVMVVPAGPLQSLPFGMLVATSPADIHVSADYRKVDWLAKHYALSVLPSASSIQAFRQFAKAGSAQEPFAGFGDPLVGEGFGSTRGKRKKIDVRGVFRNAGRNVNDSAVVVGLSEIADVESIREVPRLPETADELRAMAKALKSDQKSIWLQENATETKVKSLDLSKHRTIAFATHGVMAGEINGIGESGLILTPPKQGTTIDDGYLSTSEIAQLKLNADWVILSACNTAAADGTPGAEGLSGLAKAFFYAGARSLLVSHWPVDSDATVPLTTGMLKEYESNPAQGKAEAHRKAMMALMNTPSHPEYAHPLFWAPFVVVGEGGTGKH